MVCLVFGLLAVASARTLWHELHSYTFEDYVKEFNKDYTAQEYPNLNLKSNRLAGKLAISKQ